MKQFFTSLHVLADSCDYGNLKEKVIRDCIVVGIRNKALSEKLQLDSKLMLESVTRQVCQREAVHEQQQILQRICMKNLSVEAVQSQSKPTPKNK